MSTKGNPTFGCEIRCPRSTAGYVKMWDKNKIAIVKIEVLDKALIFDENVEIPTFGW